MQNLIQTIYSPLASINQILSDVSNELLNNKDNTDYKINKEKLILAIQCEINEIT